MNHAETVRKLVLTSGGTILEEGPGWLVGKKGDGSVIIGGLPPQPIMKKYGMSLSPAPLEESSGIPWVVTTAVLVGALYLLWKVK